MAKRDGQFKSGDEWTGNANGRPKGSVSIVEGLRRKLQEIPDGQKKTYRDLFVDKLMVKALKDGDTSIMRDVIDRIDGKPHQTSDITSKGEPIMVLPSEVISKNNIDASDSISQDTE